VTASKLSDVLLACLPAAAVTWLGTSAATIAATPQAIHAVFPAVGRCCGRGPLATGHGLLRGWTVDDAVRALLLDGLPQSGTELLATVRALYAGGDRAERRGVLRALTLLGCRPDVGDAAVPILADALRSSDPGLIGAALGDYAARYLDPAAYRQAVLKCVFCGIPLADVAGLGERADAELARALTDYAREREAAGRDVPADAARLVEVIVGKGQARAIPSP
jgi:hypothetical protein